MYEKIMTKLTTHLDIVYRTKISSGNIDFCTNSLKKINFIIICGGLNIISTSKLDMSVYSILATILAN